MRELGDFHGEPVGCFFVLRRDTVPPGPILTIHRVSRRAALGTAVSLATANGTSYEVAALDSVCDCQGRAQLEADTQIANPASGGNGR